MKNILSAKLHQFFQIKKNYCIFIHWRTLTTYIFFKIFMSLMFWSNPSDALNDSLGWSCSQNMVALAFKSFPSTRIFLVCMLFNHYKSFCPSSFAFCPLKHQSSLFFTIVDNIFQNIMHNIDFFFLPNIRFSYSNCLCNFSLQKILLVNAIPQKYHN